MPRCATCNTTILFGGVKFDGRRFCNDTCAQPARLLGSYEVPQELIDAYALELHTGRCPACEGPGPVAVHKSHIAISAIVITFWYSTPHLSCHRCARRRQIVAAGATFVVGWWGFPFGLVVTPVQIFRNIRGMVRGPGAAQPSQDLIAVARSHLVAELMAEERQRAQLAESA